MITSRDGSRVSITVTKIFTIKEQIPCHNLPHEVSTWECQDFSLKMWPYGRRNFHYHSLRSDLLRTPNADGLVESPGPIGKIIVEQPGGNVAITERQHRDDYTLCSVMYQRITRYACLFVEHANINLIIKSVSFIQFPDSPYSLFISI